MIALIKYSEAVPVTLVPFRRVVTIVALPQHILFFNYPNSRRYTAPVGKMMDDQIVAVE